MKLEAKDVLPNKNCMQAAEKAKMPFFPCDLDLQTRPSEAPNTSSLRIWCKSVPEIFHTYAVMRRFADSFAGITYQR